jgi:ketosteroid isomerase-like protein
MVRSALDAWNRGDWDETLRNVAADLVFDNSRARGEYRGRRVGPDQLKQMADVFSEPWDVVHLVLDEVVESGDRVLSLQTTSYRGRDWDRG